MLRLAGAGLWLVVGVSRLVASLVAPVPLNELLLGLGAHAVFGVVFWWTSRPHPDTWRPSVWHLAGGVVQSLSALLVARFTGGHLPPALLIVVAGHLPSLVTFRTGLVWVLAQSAALGLMTLGRPPPPEGRMLYVLGHLTFQVFALGAASLVHREAQARAELARTNAELVSTQALLSETSRTVERLRISRELHDVLGHHLTALLLQLEATARVPQEQKAESLQKALAQTRTLITETRAAVGTLREESTVDVKPALISLVQGITWPQVHLTLEEELGLRDPARAHALIRCVQELLTNTLRHSGAKNLWLSCVRGERGVEIRARDDGSGVAELRLGHGLRGMRERLEELGGGMEVSSEAGEGFSVHAWLPWEKRA